MIMITDRILVETSYLQYVDELEEIEKDREYCRHDFDHFFNVGNILYSLCLECNISYEKFDLKDTCYVIGLLHDLGRIEEYKYGISHEKALALSREILFDCKCEDLFLKFVLEVISYHSGRMPIDDIKDEIVRIKEENDNNIKDYNEFIEDIKKLLKIADQLERKCFKCSVRNTCKWKEEEKVKNEYFKILL